MCGLAGAVASSWPIVVATALLSLLYENAWRVVAVIAPAAILSVATVMAVAWRRASAVQEHPGLWALYSLLGAFPLCAVWVGLGELHKSGSIGASLRGAVMVQPFAAPFVFVFAMVVAADLAVTTRFSGWALRRWGSRRAVGTITVVVSAHFLAAVVLSWGLLQRA